MTIFDQYVAAGMIQFTNSPTQATGQWRELNSTRFIRVFLKIDHPARIVLGLEFVFLNIW